MRHRIPAEQRVSEVPVPGCEVARDGCLPRHGIAATAIRTPTVATLTIAST